MDTILFFDLETTSTDVNTARIVSISAIKTDMEFNILDQRKVMINPTISIPKEATEVHGITDDMVKNAHPFIKYSKSLFEYFSGCILAGYNIDFYDIPVLSEEFSRCGIVWPGEFKSVDACTIFKNREKRTLSAALKFYAGKDMENAHDAEADNLATIEVLKGQLFRYNLTLEQAIEETTDKDKLDFAGKIKVKDGEPYYDFGKAKGTKVKDDPGFGMWMLKQNFIPNNTKNVVRSLLNI